jgi:uncharacterized membrane protein
VFACVVTAEKRILANAEFLPILRPSGYTGVQVHGVSTDGTVIVGNATGGQFITEPFRFTLGEGFEMLGILPGTDQQASVLGVSSDGQILVGFSQNPRLPYRTSSTSNDLLPLPTLGRDSVIANGISGDGSTIVGGSNIGASGPLVWRNGIAMDIEPDPVIFNRGFAFGVSFDGSVIVGSHTSRMNNLDTPFRWTPEEGMMSLGPLPPGFNSGAAGAVSANGSVVLAALRRPNNPAARVPFRWTKEMGFEQLPLAPNALSADGSVMVGGDWIWTAGTGTRKLADALTDAGVDLSAIPFSVSQLRATAISADGEVIVGDTTTNNIWAWRAVLPRVSRHLVLVSHGHLSEPNAWAVDIRDNIAAQLESRFSEPDVIVEKRSWHEFDTTLEHGDPPDADTNDVWEVATIDWEDSAAPLNPLTARANAIDIGRRLGQMLKSQRYESVHLIGHSAGSWLIDTLDDNLDSSTDTHLTFLDAFATGTNSIQLGENADWAEHYVHDGLLPYTNETLANAYNIDVTTLDPTPEGLNPVNGHSWPWQWYLGSTELPNSQDTHNWGFARSVEFEDMHPGHQMYSRGTRINAETGLIMNAAGSRGFAIQSSPAEAALSTTSVSETGQVSEITESGFTMATGSPVWLTATFNVSEGVEFFRFDYDFLSQSQGRLSVFVDEQQTYILSEGFSSGLESSDWQWLGDDLSDGLHNIRFELDTSSIVQSVVRISNFELGLLASLTIVGDYNIDGAVDAADYVVWRNMFGESGMSLAADGTGDGIVDTNDYELWRANFGRVRSDSNAVFEIASGVPEPTFLPLVVAVIAIFGVRLKRCRRSR